MCGICGLVNRSEDKLVDRTILFQMNEVIRHRGPDSDGYFIQKNVGLAMRRLKIIDLATGDQPLFNEDGTICVVFNGEIYNYKELRVLLEQSGHIFKTNSDTEVIVHLYEDYSTKVVQYLRGMFAFAIWDTKKKRLFLARDRVGKKPLYFAQYRDTLLFGSELKCILQFPGFPRELDIEAIHHYLTLQYVPDPWTPFKGIQKLPPSHLAVWQNGSIHIERYWDLPYEPKLRLRRRELKEKIQDTIIEAVRLRLVSDVPLGVHLSSGIDSAIVVGLMAGMIDEPVKTFSIGFHEDAFSELTNARKIAQRFSTDHHELIVEPNAIDILSKLIQHFDEPFADPAAIPTWYLAQMTKQHVTVALNGDGGDESFAGYQRYYADFIADAYRLVPSFLRHKVFNKLLSSFPLQLEQPVERSLVMALRQLTRAADMSHEASVLRWGACFSESEKWALYTADTQKSVEKAATATLLIETFRRAKAKNRLDRTLYTDVYNYLPGALLPKVDRMTMAHALEARSPFLDHKVMEAAAQLPVKWKVKGTVTKRILREIFPDLLPRTVKRRGKAGFAIPLGLWFRGPLYEKVRDKLMTPETKLWHYINREAVGRLVDEHRQGRADHGKRLWILLCLEEWMQQYLSID